MKKSNFLVIVGVYSVAHGLILFHNGIFGDDWLFFMGTEAVINSFSNLGVTFIGYFHSFMRSFSNFEFLYRLLTFLSYLFAALFLHEILKRIKEISYVSRLFLVLFFCSFPVNHARISMISAPSALTYFLFYFAFWLVSNKAIHHIGLRIITLALFFASFVLYSFLSFYSIVILFIAYVTFCEQRIHSRLLLIAYLCRHYLDFLILPFLFWIIKITYLFPHGRHGEYNSIKLMGMFNAVGLSVFTFYSSFMEVLDVSFLSLSFSGTLLLAVLLTFYLLKRENARGDADGNQVRFLFLGLFFFFAGVYPYNVVGKIPQLIYFESRHQILVPLGASFVLYYSLRILFCRIGMTMKSQIFAYSFLVSLFVNQNICYYLDYERDWFKQKSLIENFRSSKVMRTHSAFLFIDNAPDLNIHGRDIQCDCIGMLAKVFHNDKYYYSKMNAECKHDNPEYKVIINHGDFTMSKTHRWHKGRILKLKWLEFVAPEGAREKIKRIVSLKFEKM